MGEEALRDALRVCRDASLEWPFRPLTRVFPFMIDSTRWTMAWREEARQEDSGVA